MYVGSAAIWFGLLVVALSADLIAQQPDTRIRMRGTVVGAGFGIGSVPGAFRADCESQLEKKSVTGSADLRIGRMFDAWRAETSTTFRGGEASCLRGDPIGADGIQTFPRSDMGNGDMILTDVRVGHASGAGNSWWIITAGVGWVWTHRTPALFAGGGLRLGGQVRLALDAEFHRYRLRWDVVTSDWQDGIEVRELSRIRETDWRSGFTLRLGLEIQP